MAYRFRTAIKEKANYKKSYQHLFPGELIFLKKARISSRQPSTSFSAALSVDLGRYHLGGALHHINYALRPDGPLPVLILHKHISNVLSLHPYYGLLLTHG